MQWAGIVFFVAEKLEGPGEGWTSTLLVRFKWESLDQSDGFNFIRYFENKNAYDDGQHRQLMAVHC